MYVYDTVTDAIRGLKQRGYILDLNTEENCLVCQDHKFGPDEFEIREYYRFEGDSDPADEAVVYAVESKDGKKGTLVTGYGISAEGMGAEMSKKLNIRRY
jgi:hypothetical protein